MPGAEGFDYARSVQVSGSLAGGDEDAHLLAMLGDSSKRYGRCGAPRLGRAGHRGFLAERHYFVIINPLAGSFGKSARRGFGDHALGDDRPLFFDSIPNRLVRTGANRRHVWIFIISQRRPPLLESDRGLPRTLHRTD